MNPLTDLPDVVKVLGQEFAVFVVPNDEPLMRGSNDGVGATNLHKQTIEIRGLDSLSPMQVVDTLVHETLHALIGLFNLAPYLEGEGDGEEEFVSALAPALLHTLRDNPVLVSAMMADLSNPNGHED